MRDAGLGGGEAFDGMSVTVNQMRVPDVLPQPTAGFRIIDRALTISLMVITGNVVPNNLLV